MQRVISFVFGIALLGISVVPARATFTSFYVFGDCLSAASNNLPVGPQYYGDRWSNGRVWVEVLAQRQGLPFYFSNSISYFGNTSGDLVNEVKRFNPPTNASNALVVIWVNNADLYYPATASPPTLAGFNAAISQSQSNYYRAITNLYAKGIRTLILPNAVDISSIPAFNNYTAYTNLLHQASTNYNAAFYATLNQVRTNSRYSDLTVYVPDFFALLTNLLAHPANYGVTNALQGGLSIDALTGLGTTSLSNGPGPTYIFWDPLDPTAMVHTWMANLTQQLISPAQISCVTVSEGSDRLDLANVPIGQNGLVLGTTNQASWTWTTNASFCSTNATQSVFVLTEDSSQPALRFNPQDGPPMPPGVGGGGTNAAPDPTMQLYRLSFPYAWSWP